MHVVGSLVFSTLGIFRPCRDLPIGIERPQNETHEAERMDRHSTSAAFRCRREGSRNVDESRVPVRELSGSFSAIRSTGPSRCPPAIDAARGPDLMIIRPIAGGVEVLAPAKLNLFLEVLGTPAGRLSRDRDR